MTRLPADLLERAPEEAARLLALSYLAEATAAEKRLANPDDHEALHDFRVAIRRLRSCCRAYAPHLKTSVTRKMRERLRGLTAATNAGRDAEVLLAWVGAQRETLGSAPHAGANWLAARLEERRGSPDRPVSAVTAQEWREIASTLKRRLSEFKTVMHLGRSPRHAGFARVAGERVQAHVADLRARLAAVNGRGDVTEAHFARIGAKRLRYLLEPFIRKGRAVPGFVEQLKGLQDLLGELRDMQLLADEITQAVEQAAAARAGHLHRLALEGAERPKEGPDESAGLVDLARRARERTEQLFSTVESEWLSGHAEPLLERIEEFGESLSSRRRKQVEIERKFLLSALPERVQGETPAAVTQGWIPGTELHERLRRMRGPDGEAFTRTIKLGNGIRRTEIEEETTREVFESLWPLTEGRRVDKRRYAVRDGKLTWEVDQFNDRDLVLAEVELPSVDTTVEFPEWLRPYVVREVTDEPEYVNLNLAK